MSTSLKPLHEQVMVITGASSGIGLATALAAAKKGAKLIIASRDEKELAKIEDQINSEGGQAAYVVADVGVQGEVQVLADAAIANYGRIDTWVNNAGISIFGRLEEISDEDNRRLFDTNFWGVVYGSLAAARHMKNNGGAIINMGSEVSDVSIPIQGMYSASKHAIKGFTDALRMELEEENAGISVTLIKPSSINTPYPEHAKNYTERELTLPPPVYAPEEVANAILHAATQQERDIMVGSAGEIMSSTNKHAPGFMDWVNEKFMPRQQLKDRPARHREGSLHRHREDGEIHGNYEGHERKKSYYTRAAMSPLLTGAAVVAAGAAAFLLSRKS